MRGKLIKILVFVCILLLGWYLYFETRTFSRGPEIVFTSPQNNTVVTEPLTTVTGYARNVTHITMNGRDIFVDPTGNFEEVLLLTPGYTIIDVAVRDRFDRTATSALTLVHVPSPPPARDVVATTSTSTLLISNE